MNRIQTGLFALGTFGLMMSAQAGTTSVRTLTPEQAQAYEVQAQQTDNEIGEGLPIIQENASLEARRIACYSRDALRVTYRVIGFGNPRMIQNQAVRYCQRMSRIPFTCRPLGCQ
jgi:hypothetical protein